MSTDKHGTLFAQGRVHRGQTWAEEYSSGESDPSDFIDICHVDGSASKFLRQMA